MRRRRDIAMRSHARLVTLTAVLVLLAVPFTAPLARAAAAPGSAAAAGSATAPPGRRLVEFKAGDETVQAYLAEPKGSGAHPGVVIIHEWWGLNDQIKGADDRTAC